MFIWKTGRRDLLWFTPQMAGLGRSEPRPKLGVQNAILVSYLGGGSPSAWIIFHCLPRNVSRELDQNLSRCDSNQHSDIGCQGHKQQLNSLSHDAGPYFETMWEREISHPVVHSTNTCNRKNWATQNQEASISGWVSREWQGPVSCCLLGYTYHKTEIQRFWNCVLDWLLHQGSFYLSCFLLHSYVWHVAGTQSLLNECMLGMGLEQWGD